MELLSDVAFLSRLQFTLIVAFHFVFVPLSIGTGLMTAIAHTRAYRSGERSDADAAWFWTKLFTTTFVVGVASGIAMEFSFGTNWADYSRFVGDIFGAPLAAEALFAFFLESVFLGVLLFGRDRVSPKFYVASSWLVWAGSMLSALWILIANSWMQTPAGAELSADGSKAVLTDFFAAAFNPTTGLRYFHVVTAALVVGGLVAVSFAAYYYLKGRDLEFAKKTLSTGVVVTLVATVALFVSAHSTALGVWNEQPTKLAAMEGQYEDEAVPLYLFGWVDESSEQVSGLAVPGFTSILATGSPETEYPGLNTLAETDRYDALQDAYLPVNAIFQVYHLMVAVSGVLAVVLVLALIALKKDKISQWGWLQKVLIVSPLFPLVAIEAGWFTAELGRQPWVVYPSANAPEGIELLTNDAFSRSLSAPELWITIILFCAIYLLLFVAWGRLAARFVKEGPQARGSREDSLDDEMAAALGDAGEAADARKAAGTSGRSEALRKDAEAKGGE